MGPKRGGGGGKHHQQQNARFRRDRGKTWDEEADNVEANVGRLKLQNDLQEKAEKAETRWLHRVKELKEDSSY